MADSHEEIEDSSLHTQSQKAGRPSSKRKRLDEPSAESQTGRRKVAFLVGKTHDALISAGWLDKLDCEGVDMLQSDEAVAAYMGLTHPELDVSVFRPRHTTLKFLKSVLKDFETIFVLESEQFLNFHDYKNYKAFFAQLHPLGCKVIPSLSTMQFMMSKVDYIQLMERAKIPHVPTFTIHRIDNADDLVRQIEAFGSWLNSQSPIPTHLLTKPSHSGSRTHVEDWELSDVFETPSAFIDYLSSMLLKNQKPYVLVQPYLDSLATTEYRLYFLNREFLSCICTSWCDRSGTLQMKRTGLGRKPEDERIVEGCRPIAQSIVDLLPEDSVLYRVDMFENNGGLFPLISRLLLKNPENTCSEFMINEVEMVDADLMPEYHPGDVDIVERVAAALASQTHSSGTSAESYAMLPSLPILDNFVPPHAFSPTVHDKLCVTLQIAIRSVLTNQLADPPAPSSSSSVLSGPTKEWPPPSLPSLTAVSSSSSSSCQQKAQKPPTPPAANPCSRPRRKPSGDTALSAIDVDAVEDEPASETRACNLAFSASSSSSVGRPASFGRKPVLGNPLAEFSQFQQFFEHSLHQLLLLSQPPRPSPASLVNLVYPPMPITPSPNLAPPTSLFQSLFTGNTSTPQFVVVEVDEEIRCVRQGEPMFPYLLHRTVGVGGHSIALPTVAVSCSLVSNTRYVVALAIVRLERTRKRQSEIWAVDCEFTNQQVRILPTARPMVVPREEFIGLYHPCPPSPQSNFSDLVHNAEQQMRSELRARVMNVD